MTFRDSLGNTWFVHRQTVPTSGRVLVVIECERASFPESPSYAAIPAADLPTLLAALRAVGGDGGAAEGKEGGSS